MKQGNEVVAIEVTPFFSSVKASAPMLRGHATSKQGDDLDQFVMVVSGSTGKVATRKRNEAVTPYVDMTAAERKANASSSKPDDDDG